MANLEQIGGEETFTYVIDPNPEGREYVNPEDLLTYVSLRSYPKSRSIIADDNSFDNFTEREVVEFITTTNQNGDKYVTTNYLNIGGINRSDEAFGIKNIDIKYGASLVPEVNITFIDTRGASVFNGYEYEDENGLIFNTSTFASFFKIPYPIYELTVKGFYGKAVTYCLHLKKFSSKFNADTGNFEITTEFIGYTFAFLADIMMKYVMAVTNMEEGQSKLTELGITNLNSLLQSFGQITRITEGFKDSSEEYQRLTVLNSLIEKLLEIQNKIGLPLSEHTSTLFTSNVTIPTVDNKVDLCFIRDVGILNVNKSVKHEEFFRTLNVLAKDYNDFITNNKSIYPYISTFKIDSFFVQTPLVSYNLGDESGLRNIQKTVSTNEPNFSSDTLITVDEIKNRLKIQNENNFDFILLNYFNVRKSIDGLLAEIKDEKKKQEEIVNKRLNAIIEQSLGFNPTIQEVFNVIIGNVDAFLSVIYDYAYSADLLGEERTQNLNINNTDIPATTNRIYPFPAVVDENGENAWLGDIVGETNPNFPEIRLVNRIIESILYINNNINKENLKNSLLQRLRLENDDWMPLNPIDYTDNEYFQINNITFTDEQLAPSFVTILLKRLLISYNESRYGINPTTLTDNLQMLRLIAELEAAYAEHKIVNENIKNIIATLDITDFVNQVIEIGLEENIISSNNGITLVNNIMNGYNFNESLGVFISEVEPTVYSNISNNNIQKFTENQQKVINDKGGALEDIVLKNVNFHPKLNPRNYYIEKDFTDVVWDDKVQNELKSEVKKAIGVTLSDQKSLDVPILTFATSMKIFDEYVTPVNSTDSNSAYLNNIHSNIGRNLTGLELGQYNSIYDTPYYNQTSNYGKALLLLKTFNFKLPNVILKNITDKAHIATIPTLYMCWVGGNLYREQIYNTTNEDLWDVSSVNFLSTSFLAGGATDRIFLTIPYLYDYSTEIKNIFIDYFISWVDSNFEEFESTIKTYRNIGLNNPTPNEPTFKDYKVANVNLLQYVKTLSQIVILSPKKIISQELRSASYPNISESTLRDQLRIWHTTFKRFVELSNKNPNNRSDFQTTQLFDKDFKIRVYNDFKEIYDKWISYGATDGKIYNNCGFSPALTINGQKRNRRLIDHFHFIDRTWSYIGDKAVINPKSLLVLSESADINLYSYIGRVLRESKFNFHVLPSYVNYYSIDEVSEMFEPQLTVDNVNSGPTFICMYVGGNSKVLDLGNQYYVNDGFDLRENTKQSIPSGFTNRRVPLHFQEIREEAGKYNMAAFRVSYADQNQNIFKSIEISQEEHRNTGEFLQIMSDLFDNRGGTQRFYKGTDLYNLYAVRSYAATVTAMGNMQIQPLQYFQLDNIPMFHGAYMISNVTHRITAHNVETTFKGYRMPKFTYPIVDVITSYLQIPLNEVLDSEKLENSISFDNYGIMSNGIDNTQLAATLVDEVADSDRILFDFGDTEYRLLPSLTSAQLNVNLNRIFSNNNVNNYGLGIYRCYAWVKNVLADLGVVQTPAFGINAWDFFAALGDGNMKYFDNSKFNNFSNTDLSVAGVKNGSFVFGFYRNSPYINTAYNKINSVGSATKKTNLKQFRRDILAKDITFNPVTHVGIYYNNQFYHLLNGVFQHPTPNFYPIAYYEFLPKLIDLSNR